MTVKKARSLRDALLIGGMVIMLLAKSSQALLVLGAVVAVSSAVPQLLYNRCPHCGRQLGLSIGDCCPFCGRSLDGKAR